MAKITHIEYNDYQRKFISVDIEPNEKCHCIPYIHGTQISFYPKGKDGHTHEILISRRHFSTGLTGQTRGYGKTWALGSGSGSAMGWTLGLSLKVALNAARAYCSIIETNEFVAKVYLNIESNMDAYSNDKCYPAKDVLINPFGFLLQWSERQLKDKLNEKGFFAEGNMSKNEAFEKLVDYYNVHLEEFIDEFSEANIF